MNTSNSNSKMEITIPPEKQEKIDMQKKIGRNIKRIRESTTDLTQNAFALEIGTTKERMNKIEKGQQETGILTIIKIADALNISLDCLCGRDKYCTLEETSNDETPIWDTISPIHAMLITLDKFSPKIETDKATKRITLTFNDNPAAIITGDYLWNFFSDYEAIRVLSNKETVNADLIDSIAKAIIDHYSTFHNQQTAAET